MKRKAVSMLVLLVMLLCACAGYSEAALELVPMDFGLTETDGITIPVFSPDDPLITQQQVPENEAMAFMRELKAGWNLGNTFDAYDNTGKVKGVAIETYWCQAKTTRELIRAIHEAGYNLIRIPVSWHNHVTGDEYTIDPAWMERVKEVATWVVEEGMYFIVNIHHDNQKNLLYPDSTHYEQSEKYVTAIWKQIAEAFMDFDEHCIFESMNEPRLVGTNYEWYFNATSKECKDAADCINRLNQKIVDVIRSSGGNNASRYICVPGYCGSPDAATNALFKIPEDPADNKIIIEVHAYRPYDFALNVNSNDSRFDLEKDKRKRSDIDSFMNSLYRKYVKQGIPVIIDEFASLDKNNLQDRVNFTAYYVASASARGMTCCLWDNHAFTGNGELLGVINRNRLEWVFPDIALAMTRNSLCGR